MCGHVPWSTNEIFIGYGYGHSPGEWSYRFTTREMSGGLHPFLANKLSIYHTKVTVFWLVVGPTLWKIWKSVGMISNPIYGKIKNGNQTTTILKVTVFIARWIGYVGYWINQYYDFVFTVDMARPFIVAFSWVFLSLATITDIPRVLCLKVGYNV